MLSKLYISVTGIIRSNLKSICQYYAYYVYNSYLRLPNHRRKDACIHLSRKGSFFKKANILHKTHNLISIPIVSRRTRRHILTELWYFLLHELSFIGLIYVILSIINILLRIYLPPKGPLCLFVYFYFIFTKKKNLSHFGSAKDSSSC